MATSQCWVDQLTMLVARAHARKSKSPHADSTKARHHSVGNRGVWLFPGSAAGVLSLQTKFSRLEALLQHFATQEPPCTKTLAIMQLRSEVDVAARHSLMQVGASAWASEEATARDQTDTRVPHCQRCVSALLAEIGPLRLRQQ
ncbi:unnamed protein product [Mesocestoides corti]|uniref:Kinesin motor domain-containing protein n=1 Tax=Mesocestoides corti TaxID=53468 RepID=A0A0R3UFX1_MESCO|nr:unnamed protein product [Mesocestoides corti]